MAEETTALFEQAVLWAEDGTGCGGAETNDQFGPDYGNLGIQPRLASNDLNGRRFFVDASLAALLELEVFHGVGEIDVATVDARIAERSIEKRAGGPDKRQASQVLLVTGLLTDHNNARGWRALAKNGLSGMTVQITTLAFLGGIAQFHKACGVGDEWPRTRA